MSHPSVISAVHKDGLSGDGSSTFGCEPGYRVGNLFRRGKPADRNIGSPLFVDLLFADARSEGAHFGELLQALGRRISGSDIIDRDAVLAELDRQTLYQSHHCR